MDVAAVADRAGDGHGREGDPEVVLVGEGADGLAGEHIEVGRADGVLRGHRQLELAGGVLGVELLHVDALLPQGFQQIPAEGRLLDEAGHPIGGAADCGLEVAAGVAAERELDLKRHAQIQAAVGGGCGHTAREGALAGGVDLPILSVAVGGRPRPAGLGGEGGEPVEVGEEPQVAVRAADLGAGGDVVVEHEDIEHGRRAHAPPGDLLQPPDRDALDPRDAAVLHKGHRDAGDLLGSEPLGLLPSALHPRRPFLPGNEHRPHLGLPF